MIVRTTVAALLFLALAPGIRSQDAGAAKPAGEQDHVAALKQSLQAGTAALRQYEWIETTVISLDGEAKGKKQNRCYYGADGKLQKVPVGGEPEEAKSPRGLRGKMVENKKEEISDSAQEAVALVKQYVPPDPAKIQTAKDQGRLSLTPPDSAGRTHIVIRDYLKAGDSLSMDLDLASNRLTGLAVSTYTDKAKDAVALKVTMTTLPDGAMFAAKTGLDVAKESLHVDIENGGHRKMGS